MCAATTLEMTYVQRYYILYRMISQELLPNMRTLIEDPEVGLRTTLSRVGVLAIVGSYDLGLINPGNREPDVDANLFVDGSQNLVHLAADLGIDLVSNPRTPWHKFEVYDNRIPKRPAMPKSVYLGAKSYVPGGKVAADVWLFTDYQQFDNANQNHQEIKSALTPMAVDTIINIKEEAQNRGLHIPGFPLYRAVLEYEVGSVDDYLSLDPQVQTSLTNYKVN